MSAKLTTHTAPLVVVMGVAGCGKSTIGAALAERLGVHFIDGDALHPVANVERMAAGVPLTDLDRWPWLADVGSTLRDHESTGLVIACSALRRSYRGAILWEAPRAVFVHLDGDIAVIGARLSSRSNHFMPPSLLTSQVQALEPLEPGEPGFRVDVSAPVAVIVEDVFTTISQSERPSWAPAAQA
jgi:gluconokinase